MMLGRIVYSEEASRMRTLAVMSGYDKASANLDLVRRGKRMK